MKTFLQSCQNCFQRVQWNISGKKWTCLSKSKLFRTLSAKFLFFRRVILSWNWLSKLRFTYSNNHFAKFLNGHHIFYAFSVRTILKAFCGVLEAGLRKLHSTSPVVPFGKNKNLHTNIKLSWISTEMFVSNLLKVRSDCLGETFIENIFERFN